MDRDNQRMAGYKSPRLIELVPAHPKSATGKISGGGCRISRMGEIVLRYKINWQMFDSCAGVRSTPAPLLPLN
jgi:hypothetical protein